MFKVVVALFAAVSLVATPVMADSKKKPKCPEGMVYKPSTKKCVWPSGSF
jgi:hypothetical protein